MNQEKIGKFIVECRKKQNLTQEELAQKFNLTNKTISKWENGKSMPDHSLLIPLAKELNITLYELLNGEKDIDKKMLKDEIIIDYGTYLETKEKRKFLSIVITAIIILVISILSLILITNKTFLKTQYTSKYDNVIINVPRFSFYRSISGDSLHNIKLKTLKQTDEVNIFIERYLNTLEKMECNSKIYYYHPQKDFTIFSYRINNDGIGFVNTIYISYEKGRQCDMKLEIKKENGSANEL